MTQNFDHYISRHMRSYYQHKLIAPVIYLALLLVVAIFYPVGDMVLPPRMEKDCSLPKQYAANQRYIHMDLEHLYFTGYTKRWLDTTMGYYYYTTVGDDCVVVLLSPESCQQGLPEIENISIQAKILYRSNAVNKLYDNLAKDLSWSAAGISSTISPYMLSEPDAVDYRTRLFLAIYFATGFYALCSTVVYLL